MEEHQAADGSLDSAEHADLLISDFRNARLEEQKLGNVSFPLEKAETWGQLKGKKLQPPEAVGHSEGCCSPQNADKITWNEGRRNPFFEK